MRHTLKAVFDQRSDAQHVVDALLASGYSPADTALSSDPAAEETDLAHKATGGAHLEGLGAAVRQTFSRLLGTLHHKPGTDTAGASTHARHVVTLTTDSDPESERAVGIIQRFGPLGLEDLHDQWAPDSAGRIVHHYRAGTGPGALQGRAGEDSRYFGTQNAEAAPTGNTFQYTMGSARPWGRPDEEEYRDELEADADAPVDDERDYRDHWTRTYANRAGDRTYDDYAPAYLFGSEARRSEIYRSRHWRDAEPALKADWEARHGPASAWDNFKDAVRHGWNRISPDMDDAS